MRHQSVALSAVGEGIAGLALLVDPAIVIRLLFGAEITGAGTIMSRIAGIALIALGLACWPSSAARADAPALRALLTYDVLVALYLAYQYVVGTFVGVLLLPALAAHVVLALLLARAWFTPYVHRRESALGVL